MKVTKKEINENTVTRRKARSSQPGHYFLSLNRELYKTHSGVIYGTNPINPLGTIEIGHAHNKREFIESIYDRLKNLYSE